MTTSRFPLRQLAAAALLAAAGASQAAISASSATSTASFASLLGGTVDSFSDLTINTDLGTTTLPRSSGSYAYTANTQTDFFVVPVAGTVALSTGTTTDTITFDSFGSAVYAFGGNFFATNVLGEVASGGLTVTATDINGLSFSRTLTGGSLSGFVGFVSDTPLASVTVSITSPNTSVYASVDNIVAVPEPATWALLLAGGVFALRAGARRRA